MTTATNRSKVIKEADGNDVEYTYMQPDQERLFAFFKEVFDTYWDKVVVGPCVHGSIEDTQRARHEPAEAVEPDSGKIHVLN